MMKLFFFFTVLAAMGLSSAADLEQITEDFGPNPTNVTFNIYVPSTLPSSSSSVPLLVYPHWCHGSAQQAFEYKPWRSLADTVGFVIIYPSTPWTALDSCWDVSSTQTLHHDAGGDSLGIASMVRWTLERYADVVDADRVFVTGVSSGAMMTNVLAAAYPDLFVAGSAFAGVPYACFAGDGYDVWSADCAEGRITRSAAEWAELVRAAYPAYNGSRPKMQLLHGTADEVLDVVNYREEIKMWTSVLGEDGEPTSTVADTPQQGWTKYLYGDRGLVEGFLADGVSHDIPDQVDEVVRFFDLDCVGDDCFSRKTLDKLQGRRAARRRML